MGFCFYKRSQSLIKKVEIVNKEEIKNYLVKRIDLVRKNEVTDKLNYLNGILFHSVPDDLFKSPPVDWKNEKQVTLLKKAFSKFSENELSFDAIPDGQIGLNETVYSIVFDNGIIETFSPRIVRQTPINFPPKIRYIQVEAVVSQFMNYLSSLVDISENCYPVKSSYTIFVTLIGIKGVVFNATEKDYTTTKTFPRTTLTFQINKSTDKDKVTIQKSIEEAIHNTLSEFEPVA